jgi:hypothetical protein
MKQSGQVAKMAGDTTAAPAEAAGQMALMMSQPLRAATGAMQTLLGMFQTQLQAVQSLAGLPQSMMGSLGGSLGALGAKDVGVPTALLAGAGAGGIGLGGGARSGAAAFGGASVGAGGGGAGLGGMPGAGLTSYTRPTSSFAPENVGRPTGLKTGLLSASELRGPTMTGGGPMAVSPAQAGMLGQGKGEEAKGNVAHVRIVLNDEARPAGQAS